LRWWTLPTLYSQLASKTGHHDPSFSPQSNGNVWQDFSALWQFSSEQIRWVKLRFSSLITLTLLSQPA
jgi:hypothetical protein